MRQTEILKYKKKEKKLDSQGLPNFSTIKEISNANQESNQKDILKIVTKAKNNQ